MSTRIPPAVYVLAVTTIVAPAVLGPRQVALFMAGVFAVMAWGSLAAWVLLMVEQAFMLVNLSALFNGGPVDKVALGVAAVVSLALLVTSPVQRFVEARRAVRRRPGLVPPLV